MKNIKKFALILAFPFIWIYKKAILPVWELLKKYILLPLWKIIFYLLLLAKKYILEPLWKIIKLLYWLIRNTGKDGHMVFEILLFILFIVNVPSLTNFSGIFSLDVSFTIYLLYIVLIIDIVTYVLYRFNILSTKDSNQFIKFIANKNIGIRMSLILLFSIFLLPILASGDTVIFIYIVLLEIVIYIINAVVDFGIENPDFKATESKTLVSVLGSLVAIVIGLLFGLLLMFIVSPSQAVPGFLVILKGGFDNLKTMGNMIYFSVPLILTGLSVAFAFRTGLFNIGASGQFTMGAFVAIFIGVRWGFLGDISPLLHWGVAIIGAMIAGGIWGSIPGLLKAYRNVNEVVASIMLNYVAMYLNTMFIIKYIYNKDYARAQDIESSAATPIFNLDALFPRSSIDAGILVAILVVLILHIVLNKTTFGYELKAVGLNRNASKYAGMNSRRNIVYSMIISGSVAGLAGALTFLVEGKHLKPINEILTQGFTGIAISLLGLSSPFGVLLAGIFYGSLQQGGYLLQLYDFNPEIIDIIIAVIIYASALALFLQKFVIKALKKREMIIDHTPQELVTEGGDE